MCPGLFHDDGKVEATDEDLSHCTEKNGVL